MLNIKHNSWGEKQHHPPSRDDHSKYLSVYFFRPGSYCTYYFPGFLKNNNTFWLCIWGCLQFSAPGPASIKMSTVHEILSKLSLENDHSTSLSAYKSVKAYDNIYTEQDTLNNEAAIKTKGERGHHCQHISSCSNERKQHIAFVCHRTKM